VEIIAGYLKADPDQPRPKARGAAPPKGEPGEPRDTQADDNPADDNPADDAPAVIQTAMAVLKCDDEACVVTDPKVIRFAQTKGVERVLERDVEENFKPAGPRNSTKLTSNDDLDAVMAQWAKIEFKSFYPYPFAMIDFAETRGSLATIDPVGVIQGEVSFNGARKFDHMACIVNTDYSHGPGKHWVCVFIDARSKPWTVEYFNSAGNPPPRQITAWMEKTRKRLAEEFGVEVMTIPVTRMRHQDSRTECGLYALYYIRRRCEGDPWTVFEDELIKDEAMVKFRAHVFRGER
jgi:hypothetical protein